MSLLIKDRCLRQVGDAPSLIGRADALLGACLCTRSVQFSTALVGSPWPVSDGVQLGELRRLSAIQNFFEICLNIFQEAIGTDGDGWVRNLLLNDAPASMREEYHRKLPTEAYTLPLFFRTDEAATGQIFEIQCPGSGWGDLILLSRLYAAHNEHVPVPDPIDAFVRDLQDCVPEAAQGVMHLLDASSNPRSMQLFLRETASQVRYWSMASDVSYGGCRFIRGHSAHGLVAENLFSRRLFWCAKGELKFDLPPLVLFDQKITLALPFHERTRDRFSDEIREILVHTSIAQEDGFFDENGQWRSFDTFSTLPLEERRYVFKYAGFDTSENWGSRGVRCGTDDDFRQELKRIRISIGRNRPWIIQPEISHMANVLVCNRNEIDQVKSEERYIKLSRFYGPSRYFGCKVMASSDSIVHGQSDTAVTIAGSY